MELQSTLWEAVATLHERVRLGMSRESFVAVVLRSVPAELGLADVEVAAGSPEVHASTRTLAVELPRAAVPSVVVLHFDRPVERADDWARFGRTVAALIDLLHVRAAGGHHPRPGVDDGVPVPDDGFDEWLLDRNAALEHELERVRALARFLVETAQHQLGDGVSVSREV